VILRNAWCNNKDSRLRVFGNMALRIFVPPREEVIWGWRKLHNDGLNEMYCSPNIVRVIK